MNVTLDSQAAPTWFGPPDRSLFGWVHSPAGANSRGAVLLCPPLARELTSAHFAYRVLADRLAAQGFSVVRFDYDGTGDSAGDDTDAERVAAWIGSIGYANKLVRDAGASSVALVGMRMGALLAAQACVEMGDVHSLVLWDPCWTGKRFLSEQRALSLLRFGSTGPDADIELPGYCYSSATAHDLKRLAMPEGTAWIPARALVLTRGGEIPAAWLEQRGTDRVDLAGCPEQERLINVESNKSELPEAGIGHIVAWLDRVHGSGGHGTRQCAPITLCDQQQAGLTEHIRALGPLGLFGIETVPAGSVIGPLVMLFNCGKDPHFGPNRQWTELSRTMARHGYRSVRFDLSGLGDSGTRPGQPLQVIHAPEFFDDLGDVAAALSPADPRNVFLVGVCSGAYHCIEAAFHLGPVGFCAVNPRLNLTPAEMATGPIDPRRRVCRPLNPMIRAYRKIPFAGLRRRLRSVAWRLANRTSRRHAPGNWMSELVQADMRALFICGEDEARPLQEGAGRDLAHLLESSAVVFDVRPGLDHALLQLEDRRYVADRVTAYLDSHFSPVPDRDGAVEASAPSSLAGAS